MVNLRPSLTQGEDDLVAVFSNVGNVKVFHLSLAFMGCCVLGANASQTSSAVGV